MTRHLHISPPHRRDQARATTPRGTRTAAEGLDAETFRGFQLAGELFLLTSFFIEPKLQPSAESLRKLTHEGENRTSIFIPANAIVTVIGGPLNGNRMVEVKWEITLMIFVEDLKARGTLLPQDRTTAASV